jgi:translation initiation factor 5A
MVYKLVGATELRTGSYVIIDNAPCVVRKIDTSKTGKHGASKVRIEAVGLIDDKKRITVKPGHERLEVPIIDKRRGQVLSINDTATIMDTETFETFDNVKLGDVEISEGDNVEYWVIEGIKLIKRKL